jgi:hypothetical protein
MIDVITNDSRRELNVFVYLDNNIFCPIKKKFCVLDFFKPIRVLNSHHLNGCKVKCKFLMHKVILIAHTVSSKELMCDQGARVRGREWQLPLTLKHLREIYS